MTSLKQRIVSLENNLGTGGSSGETLTIASVDNLQTYLNSKQDNLIAGDNISIVDNVILQKGRFLKQI